MNQKKNIPITPPSGCAKNSEIRTYRVLVLFPFYQQQLAEQKNLNIADSFVSETEYYAKPWDIMITSLGFLLTINSSTELQVICPKQLFIDSLQKQNLQLSPKFSYWQVIGNSSPVVSIQFSPDDHKMLEDSKEKLVSFAKEIQKMESKYKIILVGKQHTTGDVSYQTRLVKRRFDEIRQILIQESIEEKSIQSLMTEREFKNTKADNMEEVQSTISIYLVKN
ncbi:cell envelope biogenesis protein OmpA [Leptospira sp.]|uniref:cell envelope biogenesis protein OmpA n=1 Tax=Leptospira sp. TaxID=178 RepID=UPI0025C3A9BD|nr:cell envelope biogenesis protein OmpA [Leptospira sp.]